MDVENTIFRVDSMQFLTLILQSAIQKTFRRINMGRER